MKQEIWRIGSDGVVEAEEEAMAGKTSFLVQATEYKCMKRKPVQCQAMFISFYF